MKIQNKVALVTGGGTGIGRAVCLALADRGVTVAVNYSKSREEAGETVRLIQEQGGRAAAFCANVSDDSQVRQMTEDIVHQFGGLDLLVNNASITAHIPYSDLEACTDEVWDELLGVNVKGMFHTARAAYPYMRQSGHGAIINLGSIAGTTGRGSSLPYAVSKAAVHGLTKSLAHALAPAVRVNAIIPGAVPTRWWQGQEERMQQLAPNLLLQQIASVEDIAAAVCGALEQEAMTGQLITIDSGQTL
ncbi:SDR family oxidoreductase [Paenibacillus sp. JX-17]|uniref:SDR family oxidoreductase n=1 Tax=Paenibacillus lacisoli TaxID=3064525 RepID=A0ABT9CED4_9BACL|nr:SDR family oxidoreductase [Paenibacillus sp. JX-17]MDO7905968.1 SDR family oxidoreductase [Paenibacillus sp. JX-17]